MPTRRRTDQPDTAAVAPAGPVGTAGAEAATPAGGPRARARAQFEADLLAAARRHLATDGAAQLSLRAVARELGVASSAVYRYVESRDALLTLLVLQAYDAVGQACEDAYEAAVAIGADAGRTWLAVARAFRSWALEHPHEYALVYGTPVPGYAAPRETVAAAVRLWGVVARVLTRARTADALHPPRGDDGVAGVVEEPVVTMARAVARGATTRDALAAAGTDVGSAGSTPTGDAGAEQGGGSPVDAALERALAQHLEGDVARSLMLFAGLVGAVSAELFGHLRGIGRDAGRAFDLMTATAAAGVGLDVPLDA